MMGSLDGSIGIVDDPAALRGILRGILSGSSFWADLVVRESTGRLPAEFR